MAQSGFTPIQLYYSTTATNVPTAGNLAAGELAINTVDEKLYFKNSGGTVKAIAASDYVSLTGTQTLINKTLTSPTINGATIGTSTLTTPIVSGTPATTAGTRGFDATSVVPTYYTGSAVQKVGYLNIPQNSQSTAYTAVITDAGKHILHPSADTTARTFTIPANSSVAYEIGTAITFVNQNAAGVMTIAITTDTMRLAGAGTTGSRTLAANGVATAIKLTSTEWIISGTGLT
jgi:hypothetical protein